MITPKGTFVGLVDATGVAGVSTGRSGLWRLVIRLAAWREPGGSTVREKLRCELPVAKDDVKALMSTIKPFGIVELEAVRSEAATVTLHRIIRAAASDPDLESIAHELQIPLELVSPFGRLRYDRKAGWYDGTANWCGRTIKITLSCPDATKARPVLQVASELFSAQSEWNRRVQGCAVEKLLPLKNGTWRSDGEKELEAEEFTFRMRLTSISVVETGEFTFSHDDGDLFWGHSIQVSGTLADGPTRAEIVG